MMKKAAILAVAALAFVSLIGSVAYAQPMGPANRTVVSLHEQNGSGQTGTATLTEVDGQTMVSIELNQAGAAPQPAHIHKGTCANLDPAPAFPLTNVVDARSETTVAVPLSQLSSGSYAINVHKSAAEASVYVACGDIIAMLSGGGAPETPGGEPIGAGGGPETTGVGTVGMPRTGSGDSALLIGALVLLALTVTGTGLKLARRKA